MRNPSSATERTARSVGHIPPAKRALYATIAGVIGVVAALLLLEIGLRFFPVRDALGTQPVDSARPILHFKPNNDVVFSEGWNFVLVNKMHVNNYGFVNDQDYDPKATSPLLAVIGDSYVEAAQVPFRDTIHGRLATLLAGRTRVYSFASSGSPLSQYLAYAKYARDNFHPAALVVVVIDNDFDESLLEYKSDGAYHYFKRNGDGTFDLVLVPFQPSPLYRALRVSALARYLNGNGFFTAIAERLRSAVGADPAAPSCDMAGEVDPQRVEASQDAIDYFLAKLPEYSGLAPDRIALVIDGMRPQLYEEAALQKSQSSCFARMRSHLIAAAQNRGYRVADMEPRFVARHRREGTRFEWPFDGHWNGFGHEEAAAAVRESGLLETLMPEVERPRQARSN